MPPALEVSGLRKSYKAGLLHLDRQLVLRGISLQVPPGEVFGYLGPNGSGKTTTLKVLMGLLSADSGSISILGHPHADRAWRYRVGFLPENPYFHDYLSALESLDYMGRLFGMPADLRKQRTRELLELVGLEQSARVALRRYSKGMVQRFGIAQALINDPDLVFLDEPMSGLDPLGRRLVRDLILELRQRGKTVFFSTHILSDAETLCDRVAVLRGGKLLRAGLLDEILTVDVAHMEVLLVGLAEGDFDGFPEGITARAAVGERWRLEVSEEALGRVVRACEDAGGRVLSVQPVRQSLEDYFFEEVADDAKGGPCAAEA